MLHFKPYPSLNYAKRTQAIKHLVLHFTEIPLEEALNRLCDLRAEVSAHYLIKQDGGILRIVEEENIAWHAGMSKWRGMTKLNQTSIGIEIDNSGRVRFTRCQLRSCWHLCEQLVKKYRISPENIVGHSDIAPMRKIDPGIYFPWEKLKQFTPAA